MSAWIPFDVFALAACAAAVFAAYVIFGLTSFGAPLVSAPVLAQFLPLPLVIPLQSTLDLMAALILGGKERKQVDWKEIRWLLPPMLIGMILGTTLLLGLPKRAALLSLGVFIVIFGCAGLSGVLRLPPLPRWASILVVAVGGVLSSLFSAGGPVYVMHLTTRVTDPVALRSTIAAAALVSAVLRVLVFAISGLMTSATLWITTLVLLPTLFGGVFFGRWMLRILSPQVNRALIYLLLVVIGGALIWRFY